MPKVKEKTEKSSERDAGSKTQDEEKIEEKKINSKKNEREFILKQLKSKSTTKAKNGEALNLKRKLTAEKELLTKNELKKSEAKIIFKIPKKPSTTINSTNEPLDIKSPSSEKDSRFRKVEKSPKKSGSSSNEKSFTEKSENLKKAEKKQERNEDEMEWEATDEFIVSRIHEIRKKINLQPEPMDFQLIWQPQSFSPSSSAEAALVIDTNIFLSHLSLVRMFFSPPLLGKYKVHVAWTVLQELDYMKTNKGPKAKLEVLAREAASFIHKTVTEKPKAIRIQTASEYGSCEKIFPAENADDTILQYCLYVKQNGASRCVLLSNDILLCTKAKSNDIEAYRKDNMDELLSQKKVETVGKVIKAPENYQRIDCVKEVLDKDTDFLRDLEMILVAPLGQMLELEMKAAFDDIWEKIVLVKPPWTLTDICRCVEKHWIAVFSYNYSRDLKENFTALRNALVSTKKSLLEETQKTSLLELAAKIVKTVKFRRRELEDVMKQTLSALEKSGKPTTTKVEGSDSAVLEVFNFVWSQFNTACGTILDVLNYPHSLTYTPFAIVPSFAEIVVYLPQLFAVFIKLENSMTSFLRDVGSSCWRTRALDFAECLCSVMEELNLDCCSIKVFANICSFSEALISFATQEANMQLMSNGLIQLRVFCNLLRNCQQSLIKFNSH